MSLQPSVARLPENEKFEARATVVDSAEGDRLGSIQLQKLPGLAELQAKITRKIPVVLLERNE
jgi:hypothetical protein